MPVATKSYEGLTAVLNWLNSGQGGANWKLKLFQNAISLSPSVPLTALTECTFGGYAPYNMAFPAAALVGGTVATAADPGHQFAWSSSPPNTVYGWYVVDVAANKMIACDTLATPKTMGAAGDTLTVTITDTLQ